MKRIVEFVAFAFVVIFWGQMAVGASSADRPLVIDTISLAGTGAVARWFESADPALSGLFLEYSPCERGELGAGRCGGFSFAGRWSVASGYGANGRGTDVLPDRGCGGFRAGAGAV